MCQHCIPFMHCPMVANRKTRWSIPFYHQEIKHNLHYRVRSYGYLGILLKWQCDCKEEATIDKRLCFVSKVVIQLNYKVGITTVYIWRIVQAKLKQLQLKSNQFSVGAEMPIKELIRQRNYYIRFYHSMCRKVIRLNLLLRGSGCGSDGRVVASDTRGPWFESSHQRTLYSTFLDCQL